MAIESVANSIPNVAGRSLAFLAQVSVRPNFEVSFAAAQETAINRFNAELEKFQDKDFGTAKTVLLRAKTVRLQGGLALATTFKTHSSTNRQTAKDILDQLSELRALADPSTSAAFDTKRTEVLESIDKLLASNVSGLGAPDGLRDLKAQAEATIQALSVADAASATAALASIDTLVLDFSAKLEILELNQDSATTLVNSYNRVLGEISLKIDDIEIDERQEGIDRIKELETELASVFSRLSLSFEGSQTIGGYVAENTTLKPDLDPGSVLNLFV
jgi:molecular chaperone DnaK (HSP70)